MLLFLRMFTWFKFPLTKYADAKKIPALGASRQLP